MQYEYTTLLLLLLEWYIFLQNSSIHFRLIRKILSSINTYASLHMYMYKVPTDLSGWEVRFSAYSIKSLRYANNTRTY